MGCKETFIQTCIDYCNDDSHGYSQDYRWLPDMDCSSMMYLCAYAAGYDVPRDGTRYTGTILEHFRNAGFYAQPFDGNVWDLEPGDVVLNVGEHVEMCVYPGKFGGAHINEFGGVTGGEPGDQTGNEVSICDAYIYSGGWDWVLTPPDDGEQPEPTPQPEGVRYAVSSDPNGREWHEEMVGTHDTGGSSDTWAGELGYPAYFIAANCKIRVMTKSSFPEWLPWVDKYDTSDTDYGCAGDGSEILLVQADGHEVSVHRNREWDGVVDGVTIR